MVKKLKIALIGYGKMGKMIEQIAVLRGHEVVCKLNHESIAKDWKAISKADVAIEFTKPDSAIENIKKCFALNIPVVVGTTGWYEKLDEIKSICLRDKQALLTASNFSIGVNLFFHVNRILAQAMENLPEYNVEIEEIHHTQKLDAPSGTATTIAEGILSELRRKINWKLDTEMTSAADLSIKSIRTDDVPGTHTVKYSSSIDDIEIKHIAHNRSGFATGAVVAAEWLSDKKGTFNMSDIIGF